MNTITNIQQIFASFLLKVVETLPALLGAIILIIIGWIVATITSKGIHRLLVSLKIDSIGEKLKSIDILSNVNISISKVLTKMLYWVVMLCFFIAATETLGLKNISEGISNLLAYLPRLISAATVFVVGIFLANIVKEIVEIACKSAGIAAGRIIGSFIFYFLLIITAITALNQAGMDTQLLTQNVNLILGAILAAFAIGYGFASKDIMANLLASFYSREKFRVGQTIKVDGIQGVIETIDSTSLTLQTEKNKVVIPLQKLLNTVVEIL